MKIFVFGGGAMGLAYAGILSKTLPDITLFVRRSKQSNEINANGVIVKTTNEEKIAKIPATTNPKDLKNANIVIMLVKNYDSENAAKIIAENTKASCTILSTESGIGIEDIYKELCSPRKIMRAVSFLGCKRVSDNTTQIGENMNISIQKPDDKNTEALELIKKMQEAGFIVELSKNIDKIVWKKMIVVIAQHAMSALTGLTFGELLANKDALSLAKKLLGELQAVAEKENIMLPKNLMEIVKANWESLPDHKSSMHKDIISGKKTEIDMMNGSIVRLGGKYGISTPYNETVTKLVRIRQQNL